MIRTLNAKKFNNIDEINEFIEFLRELNTESVSKYSIEWWIAAAYLHSMTSKFTREFYAEIHKIPDDPPDFRIAINELNVDIETVVAVDEDYEEASSYCEKKLKDGTYPTNTNFMYGVEKNKSEWTKYFQKPGDPLRGPPVYGDFGRMHTAKCVEIAIAKKISKYEGRETNFTLVVYVKTPSKIYCDEVSDREWVAETVSTAIADKHRFQGIEILWSKNETYHL